MREKENFHVNPLDRDGKITLCPSDVILDVTSQIILLKSPLLAFLQSFKRFLVFSFPLHLLLSLFFLFLQVQDQ